MPEVSRDVGMTCSSISNKVSKRRAEPSAGNSKTYATCAQRRRLRHSLHFRRRERRQRAVWNTRYRCVSCCHGRPSFHADGSKSPVLATPGVTDDVRYRPCCHARTHVVPVVSPVCNARQPSLCPNREFKLQVLSLFHSDLRLANACNHRWCALGQPIPFCDVKF